MEDDKCDLCAKKAAEVCIIDQDKNFFLVLRFFCNDCEEEFKRTPNKENAERTIKRKAREKRKKRVAKREEELQKKKQNPFHIISYWDL